jgi:hypothetical protein
MCEEVPASNDPQASPERHGFRFTLKQLSIAIAVIALVLTVWVGLIRKDVTIRPARSGDPIRERYFGFDREDIEIRNVAVVNGTFTKSTWLTASLIAVQGGRVEEINGFTVGRSPNQIGSPSWQTVTITLALGSRDTPNGRVVQLGSVGHSRGSGAGGEWLITFPSDFSETFAGSIRPGRDYIIYAEGDTKIDITPQMTITEFVKRNQGNYLVVTAQLK